MRLLALLIAIIGLIITVVFTIFPVGSLTIFPAIITLICGFILYRLNKHVDKSTMLPKVIIGLALVSTVLFVMVCLIMAADKQKSKTWSKDKK